MRLNYNIIQLTNKFFKNLKPILKTHKKIIKVQIYYQNYGLKIKKD